MDHLRSKYSSPGDSSYPAKCYFCGCRERARDQLACVGDLFSVEADVVVGGGRTGQEIIEVLVQGDRSLILNPVLKLSLRICLSTCQDSPDNCHPSKADSKIQKGKIRWDLRFLILVKTITFSVVGLSTLGC